MKNKLPKVYQNPVQHKVDNNMKVFYEKYYNNKDTYIRTSLKENRVQDVNEKITELFNRNGYIFNLDVIIKTVNETLETKIAGKIKNYLITLDNKVIPISEIIEISEKN